jgi:hypothetical protein
VRMFRKFRVMSRLMRLRKATLAALVLTGAAVALAIVFGGGKNTEGAKAAEPDEGIPTVSIISPRNGEVQPNHAVVVKVGIKNFELVPASFGSVPELGEGNLHFALNRVPNCVDPEKLEKAVNSPTGIGRLKGQSMDFPEHAGPNGILAEELGVGGIYSPATQPEIFYDRLPPGFYRLIVTIAQNNGTTTPYHAVTNFQILQKPGHHYKKCAPGKVSSASAAATE